jgi:hypothetical protein
MSCTSSCRTQDHESWGACVRAKNLRTSALDVETITVQKKADKSLDAYAKARSYGIQPRSTRPADIATAVRASEQTGTAFQG